MVSKVPGWVFKQRGAPPFYLLTVESLGRVCLDSWPEGWPWSPEITGLDIYKSDLKWKMLSRFSLAKEV
jgi:hypothetical protein